MCLYLFISNVICTYVWSTFEHELAETTVLEVFQNITKESIQCKDVELTLGKFCNTLYALCVTCCLVRERWALSFSATTAKRRPLPQFRLKPNVQTMRFKCWTHIGDKCLNLKFFFCVLKYVNDFFYVVP